MDAGKEWHEIHSKSGAVFDRLETAHPGSMTMDAEAPARDPGSKPAPHAGELWDLLI